jgi:hypothetical protein
MSSANLDLERSIYAAHEHGEFGSVDWADPEVELVVADGPSPGRWTGPAGMATGFRDFLSAWEGCRAEVDEYRELDGERVLMLLHQSGRGKASRLELRQMRTQGAALFHVRAAR